jgi:hypothetical protein
MQQSSSTAASVPTSSSSLSAAPLPPMHATPSPPLPPFEQPLPLSRRTDMPRPPPPLGPLLLPISTPGQALSEADSSSSFSTLQQSSSSSLTHSDFSKPSLMPLVASLTQTSAAVTVTAAPYTEGPSSSSCSSIPIPFSSSVSVPPSQPSKPIVMKFNFAMKKK